MSSAATFSLSLVSNPCLRHQTFTSQNEFVPEVCWRWKKSKNAFQLNGRNYLKCSARSSLIAESRAHAATVPENKLVPVKHRLQRHGFFSGSYNIGFTQTPGSESTDIASVRSLAESSLKTAPTLLSSTPVLWNSPASTCNTNCSYLLQLLQNILYGGR